MPQVLNPVIVLFPPLVGYDCIGHSFMCRLPILSCSSRRLTYLQGRKPWYRCDGQIIGRTRVYICHKNGDWGCAIGVWYIRATLTQIYSHISLFTWVPVLVLVNLLFCNEWMDWREVLECRLLLIVKNARVAWCAIRTFNLLGRRRGVW